MKKIGTKQIVPLVLAAFAVVFAVVGFTQLGYTTHVIIKRLNFDGGTEICDGRECER